MKIAVFISGWPIFYLQFFNDLVNGLANFFEVNLILEDAGEIPEYKDRVKIYNLGSRRQNTNLESANLAIIEQIVKENKFDILFGVEKYGLLNAFFSKQIIDSKLIYLSFELYDLSHQGIYGAEIGKILEIEKEITPTTDVFIIQDQYRENAYYEILGINEKHKNVFYLPVTVEQKAKSQLLSREKLGIPENIKILLYVGQFSEFRFLDQLIETSDRLSDNQLIIIHAGIGNEQYSKELLEKANKKNNVVISSKKLNDEDLISLIDVANVCYGYYRDSVINEFHTGRSSTKLALYLQAGKPVICPDFPSFRADLEKYNYGVAIKSTEEIVFAFNKILDNYDFYQDGAKKAYQEVFNFERIILDLVKKIKKMGFNADLLKIEPYFPELAEKNIINKDKIVSEADSLFEKELFTNAQKIYKQLWLKDKTNKILVMKIFICLSRSNKMGEALLFLKQNLILQPYEPEYNDFKQKYNLSLSWSDVQYFETVKLYAGDIPNVKPYKNLIGLSITKQDFRHILHDITNPIPLEDNSVDSYQSEDVFEHIEYEKLPAVINEIFRVLKPGGYFRLSIPDYRCDILYERSEKDMNGNISFDPGGGGTRENPGHLWYPNYENVKNLLNQTKFACSGRIHYLHYYISSEKFVSKSIEYSLGYVQRTPDHDERVQEPYRPFSIVVDLYKGNYYNKEFETHYDSKYFDFQKSIGEFGGKANLFKFDQFIKPSHTILDFGCGGGFLLNNINAVKKYGVEINEVARNNAQSFGIKAYTAINELPDNYFDIIISNHALEHVDEPLTILKKLSYKLKPGGKIIFVVPHEKSGVGFNPEDMNQHLYTWNEQSFANLFKKAGYRIIVSERIQHAWPPNYDEIVEKFGWEEFHRICFEFAMKNDISQIRVVAEWID